MFSLLYINFPGVAKTTILEKKLTQKLLTIHNSYKMPKLEEKLKKEIRFNTQPTLKPFLSFVIRSCCLNVTVLLSLSLPLNKSCHSSPILLLPFKNACEQYQKEPGYLKVTQFFLLSSLCITRKLKCQSTFIVSWSIISIYN